jgi:hypothetical protein
LLHKKYFAVEYFTEKRLSFPSLLDENDRLVSLAPDEALNLYGRCVCEVNAPSLSLLKFKLNRPKQGSSRVSAALAGIILHAPMPILWKETLGAAFFCGRI